MEPTRFDPSMTAMEYLTSEAVSPLGAILMDLDWAEEYWAVEHGLIAWLKIAPEPTLRALLPTYETVDPRDREAAEYRLWMASDERGIPSLADLREFAERTNDAEMLNDVAEREAEILADREG